jgi:hypothetical protein
MFQNKELTQSSSLDRLLTDPGVRYCHVPADAIRICLGLFCSGDFVFGAEERARLANAKCAGVIEEFRHQDNPSYVTEASNQVRAWSAKKKKGARHIRRGASLPLRPIDRGCLRLRARGRGHLKPDRDGEAPTTHESAAPLTAWTAVPQSPPSPSLMPTTDRSSNGRNSVAIWRV